MLLLRFSFKQRHHDVFGRVSLALGHKVNRHFFRHAEFSAVVGLELLDQSSADVAPGDHTRLLLQLTLAHVLVERGTLKRELLVEISEEVVAVKDVYQQVRILRDLMYLWALAGKYLNWQDAQARFSEYRGLMNAAETKLPPMHERPEGWRDIEQKNEQRVVEGKQLLGIFGQ